MRVGLSMNNSPVDIDNNSHIDIIVLVVRVLHVYMYVSRLKQCCSLVNN